MSSEEQPTYEPSPRRSAELEEALAEYYAARDRGEVVSVDALIARHPSLADELRALGENEALAALLPGSTSARSRAEPLAPGARLGEYEIIHEIARGGMGVVYRARDRRLGREVALKVILAGASATDAERRRFAREARAAAKLDHPAICPVYDVGEDAGLVYLTLKLIEGDPIDSVPLGSPRWRGAAKFAETIARAVEHAHARGVLHRDLKPSNILVDASEQPWIVDFGLARLEGQHSGTLSRSGELIGTLRYAAPELFRGEGAQVDERVDVWGIGAVLYTLLTGAPAFRASSSPALLRQVLEEDPPSPSLIDPTVPRDLSTICLRCLAKDPARRYGSARALADDLRRFLADEPIVARPPGPVERGARWARRHPRTVTLAISLVVLISLGAQLVKRHIDDLAERTARGEAERAILDHQLYAAAIQRGFTAYREGNASAVNPVLLAYGPHGPHADLAGFEWRHLWALTHRERRLITVPGGLRPEGPLRFTADGRRLLATTTDGAVIAWTLEELATGIPGRRISPAGQGVWTLSPSADSIVEVAAASLVAWKLDDPEARRVIARAPAPVRAMAWIPGSDVIVLREGDAVREVALGDRPERVVSIDGDSPPCLGVDRSGRWIATAVDGGVLLIDRLSDTSFKLGEFEGNGAIRALAFSPDGTSLAAIGSGALRRPIVWNLTNRTSRSIGEMHLATGLAITFAGDGSRLVTAGADMTVRLHDLSSGRTVRRLFGPRAAVANIALDPSGKWLVAVEESGIAWLWNLPEVEDELRGPEAIFRRGGPRVWALGITRDGRHLVAGDGKLRGDVWRIPPLGEPPVLVGRYEPPPGCYTGSVDLGGRAVCEVRADHSIRVMRVEIGEDRADFVEDGVIPGSSERVRSVWVEVDGETGWLAAATSTGRVDVWRRRLSLGRVEWTFVAAVRCPPEFAGGNFQVALSSARRLLVATSGLSATTVIASVETGATLATVSNPFGGSFAGFTPDGSLLVVGCRNAIVRVWDVGEGALRRGPREIASTRLRQLPGHFELGAPEITRDGRRLLFSDAEQILHVHDLDLLPEIPAIVECRSEHVRDGVGINSLRASPDGSWMALGIDFGEDRGGILLWRAASDRFIRAALGLPPEEK